MGFKENLKDELSYQGIPVKELSSLTGISQGSLSNYLKENSSTPSADVAVKIATALGVSVEFLVTGHNSNIKIKDYPLDIKSIADKIENLSDRDKKIISTLIDKMLEIKQL
ncbi:MAG: helix-turn-helix transcriptional regulator [Treponema sp.]|nr:helix-turn-helix transcriptional regulator [Clostridia bacterium]MCF0241806.1 helix-turn-helix transcriptional regulator [Treponema sp.]